MQQLQLDFANSNVDIDLAYVVWTARYQRRPHPNALLTPAMFAEVVAIVYEHRAAEFLGYGPVRNWEPGIGCDQHRNFSDF